MKLNDYIDVYKEIKAPETLHDRVIKSAQSSVPIRNSRNKSWLLAAAAAFVVVTAAMLFWQFGRVGQGAYVIYEGQRIEASTEVTVQAKSTALIGLGDQVPSGIELDVHVNDTATLSVTDGIVIPVDKNGSPFDKGEVVRLPKGQDIYTVYWKANFSEASEESPFLLTITDSKGKVVYVLIRSDEELTLRKESEK